MRAEATGNRIRVAAAIAVQAFVSTSVLAFEDTRNAQAVGREDVRIVSTDGLSLFVRQYGEGKTPIVLLTGGPGYSGDYLEEMAV